MFGAKSMMHWIIVLGVFLLLFGGRNKISDLMGDVARGIKSFKKGLNEDDTVTSETTRPLDRPVLSDTIETPATPRKMS